MTLSNIFLAALTLVVLLWCGLSIWRDVASKRWHRIERSYLMYYESRQSDSLEVVPPVVWDFEAERLVETPKEEYSVAQPESKVPGAPRFEVMLLKERAESMPVWTWGIVLSRVPAPWFHGIFGAVTLLLAFLSSGRKR